MGNIAFPFRLDADGAAVSSDYEQSIRDSVQIILTTKIGERVMEKDFGVNIASYLFEPVNGTTIEGIRTEVINALYKFEPRITDIKADIEAMDGAVVVTVTYRVLQNSTVGSVTVSYGGES